MDTPDAAGSMSSNRYPRRKPARIIHNAMRQNSNGGLRRGTWGHRCFEGMQRPRGRGKVVEGDPVLREPLDHGVQCLAHERYELRPSISKFQEANAGRVRIP